MSWVDLVVVALALLAAISGWRHGMAVALLSFVGVLGGAIIGVRVAPLLAEGISNKMLAYRLGISEHTVKFHITSILTKLRAGSRTDAVMQGIRRGLIMM